MADNETVQAVEDEIARGDMNAVRKPRKDAYVPSYQMIGDTRIPVSKAHGKMWKSRRDQSHTVRKQRDHEKAWSEAIRYYQNDQLTHRYDTDNEGEYAGNEIASQKMHRRFSETENIVFANTSALVPTLYAKNPTAEFTATDPEDEMLGVQLGNIVNKLLSKKSFPGVHLKPKARKCVVMSTLTNLSYIEVGWTFREQSSEAAMNDLARLAKSLSKAKTPQQVQQIEGEIEALEHSFDVLRPAGPWCRFRRPHDVLWDTDAREDDYSDAKWCMIADHISTQYLNAKFTQKKGTKRTSVFKPTHVIKSGEGGDNGHNSAEHEINNASLFNYEDDRDKASTYGYDDEASYRKAQRTKVWWVWDKTTRRVLLYADKDWSWPIWVWDDPYKLQGFFPIYQLTFNTDPEDTVGKGEVTYYLDQQDSLNTINSEMKQARQWARRNAFFDKNRVSADEVEKFIKGDEDVAVGIDVPEGMNLKDFIMTVPPPSTQFMQLFDKQPLFEAIDRISSVQPVMRGVEFKTNTTNQAINQYNSVQQTRTDEKIDAVEDFIGNIAWALAQLAMQFMDETFVAALIGEFHARGWRQRTPAEIESEVQMTIVGGSTQKPTSEAKKQQALQMGQVLGQFVNAAPVPVLSAMLSTMRGAFNDVIPDEQWKEIIDSVQQQGQSPAPPPGDTPAGDGSGGGGPTTDGGDPVAALERVIDSMPPEAKEALGTAMARGVPVREALERIIPQVSEQQQPA